MLTTVRRLARRALSAFTRIDRLFAFRARYSDHRARLNVTALEERVVPDAVPVRAEWIGDAEEGGTQAAIRFTRTADQAAIDTSTLTVSFLTTGSATPGADFVFVGASAPAPTPGQPLTVTFALGQTTFDLRVTAIDDTISEGWESVALELQAGTGYTVETPDPVTVWLADNELWLETDADPVLAGEEVTFWLPEDLPATATVEWDTDYDGTSFAPIAGAADTWFATTFTSTGPRTVAARVTDGGTARIVTRDVTVEYPPPVLTGPDDFTATQGQTRTLGVTADTDLDIVSVVWQVSYYYGDYETDESLTGLQPEYLFEEPGEYDFWVTVTDSAGGTGEAWFHVTVTNAAPVGSVTYRDAAGAVGGEIPEGSDVWFTVRNLGIEVDVSNLDGLSVYADWYGTGEYDLIAQGDVDDYGWEYDGATDELRFKGYYDDGGAAGVYAARVWVEDEWGYYTDHTVNVRVKNVAPVATLSAGLHLATVSGANQEVWGIRPGEALRLDVTDPSEADGESLTYTWTVGTTTLRDAPAVTLPDALAVPGRIYAVEAYVRDKDGGESARYTFNLAVFTPDPPLGTPPAYDFLTGAFDYAPATDPLSTEAGHQPYTGGAGASVPGAPGGPAPGGGAIYGTLTPNGTVASNGYNRYAELPVIKLEQYNQPTLDVAFQLDPWSAELAARPGTTVRYKFDVDVYNVERYSIGPDDYERLFHEFRVNETGTLTVSDFLLGTPGELFDRMIAVTAVAELVRDGQVTHTSPPYQVLAVTPYSPTAVQQVRDLFQAVRDLSAQFGAHAEALVEAIRSDPQRFLATLTSGLRQAADEYLSNLTTHINAALFAWLGEGRLDPTKFDLATFDGDGVKAFVLQFAGLTWDHVQNVLLQELGEGNVAAVGDFVTAFLGDNPDVSDPNTMLRFVERFLNPPGHLQGIVPALDLNFDQLKTVVRDQLIGAVRRALPQLVGKFTPGAGNVVGAIQAIHRGLTFVLENRNELSSVIAKFLEGLPNLAAGDAAGLKVRLLEGMAGAGPLALKFAAGQLGLGRLPRDLKTALEFVPTKVEQVLRAGIRGFARANGGGTGTAAGGFTGRLTPKRTGDGTFGYDGRAFVLVASTTGKGDAVVTIYERVNGAFKDVKVLAEKDFPAAGDKALFNSYVSKAKQLAAGSKGTPRGQTPPPAQTQKFAALKALQHEVVALEAALINRIAQDACPWLGTGCFAAGTKLLTRRGWVAVELLAVGDELASRAEADPGAGIEWQAVEECFRRTGRVLHLHFTDGELVRTTPEHPFWVQGAGWVPAGALKAGDQLSTLSGEWVALREVYDTEQWEPVYNVRVANTHTYFVGDEHWGFALWAHNTYEFISGRRVADMVATGAQPVALTQAARERIIAYTLEEGARRDTKNGLYGHGAVANLDALVRRLKTELRNNGSEAAAAQVAAVEQAMSSYFSLTCVRDARAELERAIQQRGNWTEYIQTTLADRDARGVSRAEYEAEMQSRGLAPKTHGHHIVFKLGAGGGAAKEEGRDSRDILLYYGINPYWDKANLAYAPNDGHSKRSLAYMRDQLQLALNRGDSKSQIHDLLRDFARDYITRAMPGR